jgi:aminoglycoside phosphotransferase (APT) family kinase protein
MESPAVGPLERFTAGFSWITYGCEASWRDEHGAQRRKLVLRLGPPNGMFAPYRATPEFKLLRALEGTGVPAPVAHWASDDASILGAPFLVCERVEGEAPVPWTSGGPAFAEEERLSIGGQLLKALVALHGLDWRAAGLGEEGEPAVAQLALWEGYLRQWSSRRFPMLEWALLWLKRNPPRAPRLSIVHGDFRIGNFLVAENRITAILDWELAHVGDPHEDLGWLCLQAFRGRSPYMCHLFGREELYRRYEELSGMAVSAAAVHYYEVFGTLKLIVIHLGAAHCFETRGFNDLRMPVMGAQVPRLLLQLETLIR